MNNSELLWSLFLFFNLCILDSKESEERSMLNGGIGTKEFLNDLLNYTNSQQHSNISEKILIEDINFFIRDECRYLSELQLEHSKSLTVKHFPKFFKTTNQNVNRTIMTVNAYTSRALFILFIKDRLEEIEKDVVNKSYTSSKLFNATTNEFLKFGAENMVLKISDLSFAVVQHHILQILFKHQFDCITTTVEERKPKIREMFNEIQTYIDTKHTIYKIETTMFYVDKNFTRNNLAKLEFDLLKIFKKNFIVREKQSLLQRSILSRRCMGKIRSYINKNAKRFLKLYFKKNKYFSSEIGNILEQTLNKEVTDNSLNIENKIINLLLKKISEKLPKNEGKLMSLEFIWNHDDISSECAELKIP